MVVSYKPRTLFVLAASPRSGHLLSRNARRRRAKTRRDIIRNGGYFSIRKCLTKRRHDYGRAEHRALRALENHLNDIDSAWIVEGACTCERRIRRQRAGAGPVMTRGAGAFENPFAERIDIGGHTELRRRWCRLDARRRESGAATERWVIYAMADELTTAGRDDCGPHSGRDRLSRTGPPCASQLHDGSRLS